LHGGSNLVVRLGYDVFYAYHAGVITQRAEGINSGHASGFQLQTSATTAALPIALLSYTCQIVPDGKSLAGAG